MKEHIYIAIDLKSFYASVECNLCGALERLASQADADGDNRAAQEYNQLWEILIGALEQLDSVLGQTQT